MAKVIKTTSRRTPNGFLVTEIRQFRNKRYVHVVSEPYDGEKALKNNQTKLTKWLINIGIYGFKECNIQE